ncbi:MAG: carboxypeptidase-like regulatory domain-containing protein [Oscillospiraceae bacterium]|nr:carboxypeptidase-like regulatory domain-containing protein [Oscillospiraceae bacterium]
MASMIIDDNYAYGEMRLTGSNVGYCINAAYCGEEEYDDEVVDPDTDDDYGSGRLNGANFSCENGEQPDECMLCPTTPSDDDAGSGSCPGCCVPDLSLCMVPFTGLIGSITSMQEALARLTVAESNQLDAAATMPDIELAEAGALNDSLRGLTCCIGNVEASLVQEVKCILNVCKCHNPAPAASVNLNANALADANRVSEKNARFTLRGPRLGAPQTVVSDKNGALHLGWLHPGQYTLTPAKPTNSGARSYQVSVGDDESITIKTADGALATDLMPETAGAESDKIFKIWKQIQTRTKKRLKDEKEVKIPAIPLHERMSDHVDELSSLVNMWAKS